MLMSFAKTLLGLSSVFASLYYAIFVIENAGVTGGVFHGPSLFLVVGVLFGIALMIAEFDDFMRFGKFLFGYSVSDEKKKLENSEQNFEQMLNIYANEGIEAFRQFIEKSSFPKIWRIVATKMDIQVPIEDIRSILRFQIRRTITRMDQDIQTLRQLAALAPSVGMFGSVLGLIRLLANMKDFNSLGANMSLALITTLYGIFIANVFFVPLIRRLEARKFVAQKNHENVMYWMNTVAENKPAFYLKGKLREIVNAEK
jgi:chemotaxis protein MotA